MLRNVVQPIWSQLIQALEQRLGARLLNRNTRHVKPTEVGEFYK